MLGVYIDRLSTQAKWRIVEQEKWGVGMMVHPLDNETRCLVGVTEDYRRGEGATNYCVSRDMEARNVTFEVENHYCEKAATTGLNLYNIYRDQGIGGRFDRLCGKFGKEKTVRLVKTRAVRGILREARRTGSNEQVHRFFQNRERNQYLNKQGF